MDIDYGENLKQALLKMQDSLNEFVTNSYLLGVHDGNELGLKASGRESNTPSNDAGNASSGEPDLDKPSILKEIKRILRDNL